MTSSPEKLIDVKTYTSALQAFHCQAADGFTAGYPLQGYPFQGWQYTQVAATHHPMGMQYGMPPAWGTQPTYGVHP